MICDFRLSLAYFTQDDNLQVHPYYCKWHYFVLFMTEEHSVGDVDRVFIHASVDGHFGCSHVLAAVKSGAVNTGRHVSFGIRVFFRRRQWQPTPVLLPGKSHGWRSLVGYSPSGCKESDTTERLHVLSGIYPGVGLLPHVIGLLLVF